MIKKLITDLIPKDSIDSYWKDVLSCMDMTDEGEVYSFTFSELGVTKKMIATELVEQGCLPNNFFKMNVEDDPRYKEMAKQSNEPVDQL